MFAVKDSDAIENASGEKAVGRNRPELRRAESGARDDGWSNSYPRVGYRLPCLRLGAFLGLEDGRRAQSSATQLATGVPRLSRSAPGSAQRESIVFTGRDFPSGGPQESRHFAGDRRHDDGRLFARGAEAAITSAQTHLRLPGDVTYWLGQAFEPRSQGLADPRWITIGPSRLDERSPRSPIARQSEALPSDCIACRAFRRNKPEERCELSWRVEPAHVADLSGKGHGDEKRSATHGLIGFHYRRHGPLRHNEGELLLDGTQGLKRIFDRVDGFLKDDLLRGMVELLTGEPTKMRWRPVSAAAVSPAVPEQEREKLLTLSPKIVSRPLPGARKIPDRLMGWIGRPHSRKLTRPMKTRQGDRVPTVRLDPLARSFRDQRRSNHHAVMPERLNLAIRIPLVRPRSRHADDRNEPPIS